MFIHSYFTAGYFVPSYFPPSVEEDATEDVWVPVSTSPTNDPVWKGVCPVCGWRLMEENAVRRWDGVYVDKKCWEPRHPMDLYNVKPEDQRISPAFTPEAVHAETDTSSWGGVGETSPGGR